MREGNNVLRSEADMWRCISMGGVYIYMCLVLLNILLTSYLLNGQCTKYVGEAQYVSPSRLLYLKRQRSNSD